MKLTAIHQIEITSRCNLRCRYCAHPQMARKKEDMDAATFAKALSVAETLHKQHGHCELNLCGIGESTLHPMFVEFMKLARFTMPRSVDIILATNGIGWTPELAEQIAILNGGRGKVRIWVSLHRPEKAGPTVELLRRVGLLAGVSADPSVAAVNWAGQVDYHVSAPRTECPWLAQGWGFVMADGRIGTCCFDGAGVDGVLGTIWDNVSSFDVKPYSLCPECHHTYKEKP